MKRKNGSLLQLLPPLLLFIVSVAGCGGGGDSGSNVDSSNCQDIASDSSSGKVSHSITCAGSVTVKANSSEWVTVGGSSNALSASSLEQGGGSVNEMVFTSNIPFTIDGIRASGGATYYEIDRDTGSVSWSRSLPFEFWLYYVGLFSSDELTLGAMIPMLSSVQGNFPSGDYQFKLRNPNDSDATMNIHQVHKQDPNFSTGEIDINLFIYRAGEDNEVIPNASEAENVKRYMNDVFRQVGITVRNMSVTFRDDADAIVSMDTEDNMNSFLKSASRGTKGRTDVGINCFLFPRLPGNILGVDGSIPGPGFLHGVSSSGIIAQASAFGGPLGGLTAHESDQRMLAKILSHEIGHYLNLLHTTEAVGFLHDPLGDTPECDLSNDLNGDGRVTGDECRGKGASNLMFWTTDPGLIRGGDFQEKLSSDQGRVANTHPSVL